MTITAHDLAAALGRAERRGSEWYALCPAHDDHDPSLAITEKDGKILVICRAGCLQAVVINHLRARGLWYDEKPKLTKLKKSDPIVRTYDYRDESGALRYQVVRTQSKRFWQRRPNGSDEHFINGLGGTAPLPYRLPDLLARSEEVVLVAEGEKDCDNLAALGALATCNHGGTGNTKLWNALARFFTGRRCAVLSDNDDVGRKHADFVASALIGAGAFVRRVDLPGLEEKGDDVSDWLAAGHGIAELWSLVDAAPDLDIGSVPPPLQAMSVEASATETRGPAKFAVIDGCLTYLKPGLKGEIVPVPLANFAARIIEDQIVDDGATETRRFKIIGELCSGTELQPIAVPADEFIGTKWIGPRWGARPIVHTGAGAAMICEAIQTVSAAEEKRIFGNLGWRVIDGEWVYLHAGGAIGESGAVPSISVEIEGPLSHFVLPEPGDLIIAVRKSIELFRLNPIIACSAWRAPTGEFSAIDLSIFTEGRTGTFKSALQGVAQAHWGRRFGNGRHFAANWSSTANYLEKITFFAKDTLIVIDDFVPGGSRVAVNDLHLKAEQVLRAQGNLGGRGRLDRNTRTRPTYHPRGLIASSGEDVPFGQSLRARMVIDNLGPNDIDPAKLAALQKAAAAGLLAEAMAGYVQWLAGRANGGELHAELAREQTRLCEKFSGEHRRTAHGASSLMLGATTFLKFALEIDAIRDTEAAQLLEDAEKRLFANTATQGNEQRQQDPVDIFVNAIGSLLAAGRAHLAAKDGSAPDKNQSQLGWRQVRREILATTRDEWAPHGERVGWIVTSEPKTSAKPEEQVWLLPDESYAAVERLLRDQGRSLGISRHALGKRLRERNWLIDTDKNTYTKTNRADAGTPRVLVFDAAHLLGAADTGSATPAASFDRDPTIADIKTVLH